MRQKQCILQAVVVLDWAAEGDLYVMDEADTNYADHLQIPYNYDRFKVPTDNDLDGLTSWEEYRGFVLEEHTRLSDMQKDLFINSAVDFLPDGWENLVAEKAGLDSLHHYNGDDVKVDADGRKFLDFESNYLTAQGERQNILCKPGYHLPGHAECQYAVVQVIQRDLSGTKLGCCVDRLAGDSPGCCYNDPICIDDDAIRVMVNRWKGVEYGHCMELDSTNAARNRVRQRVVVHEFGHLFGFEDIENGSDTSNVMTYIFKDEFFPRCNPDIHGSWDDFFDHELNSEEFRYQGNIRLRP